MANKRIREEMILASVSITELAEKLGVTDEVMVEVMVGRLNSEMGIMESFKVMSAVSEIKMAKESS